MIIGIRSKTLGALGRIYELVGGINSIDKLDMGPLSAVHDVSREAELAAAVGPWDGYFTFALQQPHAATGTLYDTVIPATAIRSLGFDPNVYRMWVIAVAHWADVQAGNSPDESGLSVQVPGIAGISLTTRFTLSYRNAFGTAVVPSGGTLRPGITPVLDVNLPFFCPLDAQLQTWSAATIAAGTQQIEQHVVTWIGPLGARPPLA